MGYNRQVHPLHPVVSFHRKVPLSSSIPKETYQGHAEKKNKFDSLQIIFINSIQIVHNTVIRKNEKNILEIQQKRKLYCMSFVQFFLMFGNVMKLDNYVTSYWMSKFLFIKLSLFTLIAIGERSIGPSCWGSPAKTSCPPTGVSVLNSPARGTRHSGCREWPASSMNT